MLYVPGVGELILAGIFGAVIGFAIGQAMGEAETTLAAPSESKEPDAAGTDQPQRRK